MSDGSTPLRHDHATASRATALRLARVRAGRLPHELGDRVLARTRRLPSWGAARITRAPIVPAAILFDLRIGDFRVRPDRTMGYLAAQAATSGIIEEGNVGAGTGATVGKLMGPECAMKGGVGTSGLSLPGGVPSFADLGPSGR